MHIFPTNPFNNYCLEYTPVEQADRQSQYRCGSPAENIVRFGQKVHEVRPPGKWRIQKSGFFKLDQNLSPKMKIRAQFWITITQIWMLTFKKDSCNFSLSPPNFSEILHSLMQQFPPILALFSKFTQVQFLRHRKILFISLIHSHIFQDVSMF